MKFGVFYELQLPRPWAAETSTGCSERARPDRARRPARLRLRVGGRAPLPRGVLALLARPRCSSPRRASARSNIRLGHGIVQLTTNHPARVAERVARSTCCQQRARRARHGRGGDGHRAASVRPPVPRQAGGVGGRRAVPAADVLRTRAGSTTASTSTSRCATSMPKPCQKPHPPLWVACSQLDTIEMAGARGIGALGFQFVSAEAAHAWVNAYYNAFTKRLDKLVRLRRPTRTSPSSVAVHVRADRRGGACQGRRIDVLPVRAALLQRSADPGRAGHGEPVGGVPGVPRAAPPGQKAHARRADRLARTRSAQRLRKFEESNVDQVILLNQAGKNTHEDIWSARAVRRRGDARVPRARARAPGVEAGRAGGRDRARRDRHHSISIQDSAAPTKPSSSPSARPSRPVSPR